MMETTLYRLDSTLTGRFLSPCKCEGNYSVCYAFNRLLILTRLLFRKKVQQFDFIENKH